LQNPSISQLPTKHGDDEGGDDEGDDDERSHNGHHDSDEGEDD
jgi:hypothetical protein